MFSIFLTIVLVVAWVRFLAELRQQDEPEALTPHELDRMECLLARCEAERRCLIGLDPMVVDQWVAYLEQHNAVLVIGTRELAAAVSLPKPARVH